MLSDVEKISVQNDFFSPEACLQLFPSKNKGTLIYGRNGSGKSSISRAFKVASGENNCGLVVRLFDARENEVILTEEDKKKIFVFNEDYVDKNIKFQEDHLDTIVMMGDAASLTEAIDKCKESYLEVEKRCDALEVRLEKLRDEKNIASPFYYIKEMTKALRGDDSWAGRDREINGRRINKAIRDDKYKDFIGLNPSKSEEQLLNDYNIKLKELESTRLGRCAIVDIVPEIAVDFDAKESRIRHLLSKKIVKPELTEREQSLLRVLEEEGGGKFGERLYFFRDEENKKCPFCFQDISSKYREDLILSMERVLNKRVESHLVELGECYSDLINLNLEPFKGLGSYCECVQLVENVNLGLKKYNDYLEKKRNIPYVPIVVTEALVCDFLHKLKEGLKNLEMERQKYNEEKSKIQPIIDDLNRINNELASFKIKQLAKFYFNQKSILIRLETEFGELNSLKMAEARKLDELEAKKRNVTIAVDSINACLKYIFFEENRLKLEYKNSGYRLLSNGQSVRPCDISEGERNIIGLSYFFTSILDGRDERSAYSDEHLIVIDDPVSSYDIENRVGVLSFLNYKLGKFLMGCPESRVLVMTHDLRAFFEINNIFKELIPLMREEFGGGRIGIGCYELRNKRLIPFSVQNRQEYTELISIIYRYAKGGEDSHEVVIGNIMRQVLEAFGTFVYKEGISKISYSSTVLNSLRDKEYQAYFQNLMYRLVLNGGSHRMNEVQSMSDLEFFTHLSQDEKRRTAKDVLCFIYLLNEAHVLKHLENEGDVKTNLNSWCLNIKSQSANL